MARSQRCPPRLLYRLDLEVRHESFIESTVEPHHIGMLLTVLYHHLTDAEHGPWMLESRRPPMLARRAPSHSLCGEGAAYENTSVIAYGVVKNDGPGSVDATCRSL